MNEANLKQVKVDNWGIFFLQRLQQFFTRSEYCDLILQFSNNEQVKVHRLVLNACTEYFQTLEKQGSCVGECLIHMPGHLQADVVVPIINFMYTGRLEFRSELHTRLYSTAQQMNMTVLTKLLDAQALPLTPAVKPLAAKKAPPAPVTWNLQGRKILPKHIDPDLPEPLPGRKLPIWKRRSVPPSVPSFFNESAVSHSEGPSRVSLPKAEEVARPTRFEWPEDDFQTFTSSFDDISYESKPLVKPMEPAKSSPPAPSTSPAPRSESKTVSFEDIRRTAVCIKRPMVSSPENGESKKPKMMDLQAVKEYVEEHRLRKDLLDTEDSSEDVDDDLAVADLDDDDDDIEDENDTPVGVLSGPAPVAPTKPAPPQIIPQKSILKTQISHEETQSLPVPTPSKKVRFSLDPVSVEGKENESKAPETGDADKQSANRTGNVSVGGAANAGNLSNHAKIITEVLKKYPHLVKNNKNIRLKIMQRGGQTTTPTVATDIDSNKVVKSKVSYVVLKSEVAGKGKPAVVLKHGGHVEPLSELGSQKTTSGAENTTGPWLCHSCGTNEEPINFETYYQYRRHLQDVHMEKIDARICEHCGHRASKRNLLLYHLYTRHNIPPPRNCQFPKCDQCDYVALSESLLIKHRNNHSNNKEFVCKVCNAAFKSNGALQGHMQTNLHSDPAKKLYECPFCLKPFVRNINLKAHMRTAHKDLTKKLDEETRNRLENQHLQVNMNDSEDGEEAQPSEMTDDPLSTSEVGEVMEVPVINAVPQAKTEAGAVVLTGGMTVLAEAPAVQSLVPSSEAEALHNVAHGIAASLGLENALAEQTVIVLDENQEYILHTTEVVREETASTEVEEYVEETAVGTEDQEYVVPEIITGENQEYIVPEIISGEDQEYIVPEIITSEDQSYAGPLSDLEHYTGESQTEAPPTSPETENRALAARQPTAPPPLNVIPEGDEIALVLSDHDYAEDVTHKENCSGEGMMFIITQPIMDSEGVSNVIQQPEHAIPSLQVEELVTRQDVPVSCTVKKNSNNGKNVSPIVLSESEQADNQAAKFAAEGNQLSLVQHKNRNEIQSEVQAKGIEENDAEVQVIAQVNSRVLEPQNPESGVSQPSPIRTYSSARKIIPPGLTLRGIPVEQMADLVKEWDEFDEDSCDDSNTRITNSVVERH